MSSPDNVPEPKQSLQPIDLSKFTNFIQASVIFQQSKTSSRTATQQFIPQSDVYWHIIFLSPMAQRDTKDALSLTLWFSNAINDSDRKLCYYPEGGEYSRTLDQNVKIKIIYKNNTHFVFIELKEYTRRIPEITIFKNSDFTKFKVSHIYLGGNILLGEDRYNQILHKIADAVQERKEQAPDTFCAKIHRNLSQVLDGEEIVWQEEEWKLTFRNDIQREDPPYTLNIEDEALHRCPENFNDKPIQEAILSQENSPIKSSDNTSLHYNSDNRSCSNRTICSSKHSSADKKLPCMIETLEQSTQTIIEIDNLDAQAATIHCEDNHPEEPSVLIPPSFDDEATRSDTHILFHNRPKLSIETFQGICYQPNAKEERPKARTVDAASQYEDHSDTVKPSEKEDKSNESSLNYESSEDGRQRASPLKDKSKHKKQKKKLPKSTEITIPKMSLIENLKELATLTKIKSPRGLPTMNNNCFLNSSLQCVFSTPLLVPYFLQQLYQDDLNPSEGSVLTESFIKLLKKVRSSGKKENTSNFDSVVELSPLVYQLKSCVATINPIFEDNEQQDAYEFLSALLEGLSKELNRVIKSPKYTAMDASCSLKKSLQTRSNEWHEYMLARENSVISDLLQGQLLNRSKCGDCSSGFLSFEPFTTLSLAFKQGKTYTYTLENMLKDYIKEDYSAVNYTKTPNCQEGEHCYISGSIFWRLPEILIFHFKRFNGDENSGYKKIDYKVSYPVNTLDLTPFVTESTDSSTENPLYSLFGVVNHSGSLQSGHYNANCMNFYNKKWYLFDDETVKRLEKFGKEENIIGEPYLLFYARKPL